MMSENEKMKRLYIVIMAIAIIWVIIETICMFDAFKTSLEIQKENEELTRTVEIQKSVIMDLEEDLRRKE